MICKSEDLLNINKIRITKARKKILDYLIETQNCVCIQKIFDDIKKSIDIDLATVYRSVNLFVQKGIIRELKNTSENAYFEMNCVHNPVHPHFICLKCNNIKCFPRLEDSVVNSIVNTDKQDRIDTVEIFFKGICKECRNLKS